ncbi:hypothetical protein P175DRAFT_0478861 [Aspergillus ochraceoroseus IBT 24754]|uniref:Uncharacterized protein n=3 Tax=Aspergillus subgen. Nidulantes TaxID=2720870 RepID=A0A0F8XDW4_9EURO|nr:uncharacterized protein P175DRAFT_0478861 [Aspergillus ochraceoroseus IBT 24754]KKK21307.1 hypothetical protein AOCH_000544 [Aspergillus ochraceoroseus]KKK21767.1 hypothetical protein ARAM_001692 [Aspergillus rambellii]PTU20713.1 hypothetical protein P175DRAFT_0478861 [Aspergillus ochraceoroseus IBT 24754]
MLKPIIVLAVLCSTSVLATSKYCPFYGIEYPPPSDLSSNSAFNSAVNSITATLDSTLAADESINTTSFAIQIFSTGDSAADPLFTYYYTSPATRNASVGVTQIDGDTVFRVGSVSKVWTLYLWLLNAQGDKYFNQPIVKYVPELQKLALKQRHNATQWEDQVDFARWGEITVGELASQMAGITRDYGFTDLATQMPQATSEAMGLTALKAAEIPVCGAGGTCNRTDLLSGFSKSHPVFPSSYSPAYSNAAFQILSYALERITGTSFEDLLSETLIKPLNLTRSSYSAPDTQYGVIPGTEESSYWSFDVGEATPAGGIYSSPNDLSSFGRSILSHTLLSPALTRRWLTPVSHTSSLNFAVGYPWEIYSFETTRPVDLFTKTGDLFSYAALIGLLPDHGVGLSVLAAGADSALATGSVPVLANLLSSALVPALEEAAKEEAAKLYTGTYAEASTTNATSAITFTVDDSPGLSVTAWTNNGINMLETVMGFYGAPNVSDVSVRLYYSGLQYRTPCGSTFVGFRAIMQSTAAASTPAFDGPFTQSCISWQLINVMPYGNVGLDEFLFELNADGDVVSVQPRALRITLAKQ